MLTCLQSVGIEDGVAVVEVVEEAAQVRLQTFSFHCMWPNCNLDRIGQIALRVFQNVGHCCRTSRQRRVRHDCARVEQHREWRVSGLGAWAELSNLVPLRPIMHLTRLPRMRALQTGMSD